MRAYVIDINGIYTEVVCNIRRLIGKYQNARINTPSFICQTQDKTGIEEPDYVEVNVLKWSSHRDM
jgi:hypothetical protein